MIESVYYQISIESLENNNGETLEKWLKKYLKDNYNDKDKFRIDMGPTGEPIQRFLTITTVYTLLIY
jgi:hypothetical protein